MVFVFDPRKNESNIAKHKVSLEEVQAIWDDPDLLVLPARRRREKRRLAIGRAPDAIFSAIYTMRGDAIRLISARRATRKEAQLYEQSRNRR